MGLHVCPEQAQGIVRDDRLRLLGNGLGGSRGFRGDGGVDRGFGGDGGPIGDRSAAAAAQQHGAENRRNDQFGFHLQHSFFGAYHPF